MADKNIKKEAKKPKKSDKLQSSAASSFAPRPVVVQPQLIKKEKKIK